MIEEDTLLEEAKAKVLEEPIEIYNINDILYQKDEELSAINVIYKNTWDNYNLTKKIRRDYIIGLNKIRIQFYLVYFIPSILDNDIGLEIDRLSDTISKYLVTIKDQKKLLIAIKSALKELEKRTLYCCHEDINTLIQLILFQDLAISNIIAEEKNNMESRFQKINVQTSDSNYEELEKINNQIDVYVRELGLK